MAVGVAQRFTVAWAAFVGLVLGACALQTRPPAAATTGPLNNTAAYWGCDWTTPDLLPEWCVPGTTAMAAATVATPFLPWPPPRPAHYLSLDSRISTAGTLGAVADRLARRLTARGYENFLYYEVPGGFALTTELERFDDAGRATGGSKRFQRGKLGGWYGFPDLLKKLFIGEEGRFRVFVFVVSSEPFPIADYPAKEVDVERWGKAGSLYLSKAIASQKTSGATDVTLLVYEFIEDRGRTATLTSIRRSVSGTAHLRWLGLAR